MNLVLTVRVEIHTNQIFPIRSCDIRSVLRTDTIVVSCGLANFEQPPWSTHRRHEFWGTLEERTTTILFAISTTTLNE